MARFRFVSWSRKIVHDILLPLNVQKAKSNFLFIQQEWNIRKLIHISETNHTFNGKTGSKEEIADILLNEPRVHKTVRMKSLQLQVN